MSLVSIGKNSPGGGGGSIRYGACLLYTSDAADERSSVDLGGRRIIKKKKTEVSCGTQWNHNKTENEQIDINNT